MLAVPASLSQAFETQLNQRNVPDQHRAIFISGFGFIWTFVTSTEQTQTQTRLLDMDDVKTFLSHLAMNKQVAASSQNQAFNALLFLFKHVLLNEFGKVEGVVRAKRRPSRTIKEAKPSAAICQFAVIPQ
jgi:hypothetical protein